MPLVAVTRFILVAASVCAVLASVGFAVEDALDTQNGLRCMHDEVMAKQLGGMSMEAALASANYRAAATVAPRPPPSSSTSDGYNSLRIAVYTEDVRDSNKYCTSTSPSRPDLTGNRAKCNHDNVLTPKKRDLLVKTIIPAAVKMHEERLRVQRLSRISLPSMTGKVCGSFTIPKEVRANGVSNADFVLFVAAAPTDQGSSMWAVTCGYSADGRPLVGVLNVGPLFIVDTDSAVRRVAHEILHVLGFEEALFAKRGMTGTARSLRGITNVPVVISPNVVLRVGNHFGCELVPGMELFKNVSTGVTSSHWSIRNAQQDLMSVMLDTSMKYTAITMAAMEDLGFYKPDYTKAEHMEWGFKAGCGLLRDKCVTDGVNKFPNMFCADVRGKQAPLACTADRLAVGYCHIGRYPSALPPHFQYFSDPHLGDMSEREYCPMVDEIHRSSCVDGSAQLIGNSIIGLTSRCVDVAPGSKLKGAICVDRLCVPGSKTYRIKFLSAHKYLTCSEGSIIDASDTSPHFPKGSTIVCPPYTSICETKFDSLSLAVQLDSAAIGNCDPSRPGSPGCPGTTSKPITTSKPTTTSNPGNSDYAVDSDSSDYTVDSDSSDYTADSDSSDYMPDSDSSDSTADLEDPGNAGNPGNPATTDEPGSTENSDTPAPTADPNSPGNTGRPCNLTNLGLPGYLGNLCLIHTISGSALGAGLWAATAVLSALAVFLMM